MPADFGGGGGEDASGAAGPDQHRRLRRRRSVRCGPGLEAKVSHEAAAADEVVKGQLALPEQESGGRSRVGAKMWGRRRGGWRVSRRIACYRGNLSAKGSNRAKESGGERKGERESERERQRKAIGSSSGSERN